MKKLFSLLVAAVMMMCFSVSAFALFEEKPVLPIEPEAPYLYTKTISSTLGISGGTATCITTVRGYPDKATKIEVTHYLKKMVTGGYWSQVHTETKTFNSWCADFKTTCSKLSSSPYQLVAVAKVYSGDNYETVRFETDTVYY